MNAETSQYEPEFEILTDKDDILDLYHELEHDQDLSAFGKYEKTVAGTVYNALNKPDTYVVIAYGPNNEVWGISTGIILEDNTAKNWWVIRAKHDHLKGFGSTLRAVERAFLINEGVSARRTAADTENGRNLILSNGATPIDESPNEYINFLPPADQLAAK